MEKIIDLTKEMLKRAQLNRNTTPRLVQEQAIESDKVALNPYPEALAKVMAGELDPLALTPAELSKQASISRAKSAVANMGPTNGSRRAVEALVEVLEGPKGD